MSSQDPEDQRWRLVFDNAPVGIALVALDGTWLRTNFALREMLGYPAEAIHGMTFQDITHSDDLSADLQLLDKLVNGTIPSYRMHKRYWHAEGHEVPVDLSVSMVRDADGHPLHFVAHVTDLSEETRSAAHLRDLNATLTTQARALARSNADLERFAMLVSHDLQSPLATVTSYLQLLQDEQGDRLDDDGRDWLQRANSALTRMSALTSSLLTLSQPESPAQRIDVFLDKIVDEVSVDLADDIAAAAATIEVAAAAAMKGDPTRLRQVVQNLIQNALKYRDPSRAIRIRVSAQPSADSWSVRIEDNGLGVPADRRDAIFDLFARLPGLGGTAGHGIGLATCRRIVEAHGGRIWVEDIPTGEGSAFVFTLVR